MHRTRVKGGEKEKEDDRLFVRIVVPMETDRTKTDGREGKMKKVAMVVFTVLLGLCLAGNVLAERATKDESIAKTKEGAKVVNEKGLAAGGGGSNTKDGQR